MKTSEFFEAIDNERIVAAIAAAEDRSRGEIRVHVASDRVEDAAAAARSHFERLGMTRTKERNGVLVLVAPESQRFAVLGDAGLDHVCGEGFWDEVVASMGSAFREGRFTEGIVAAVERVGKVLATHFPRRPGETDVNELPDTISRG